jgi:hypothetical protein
MMRLALLLACLLPASAQAVPHFIGPWFIDATINTATGTPTLTAGQNTAELGITFTCFDHRLSLGIWKPESGLRLTVPSPAMVSVQIAPYDAITVKGYATAPNLAEFYQNVGLMMREMLVGENVSVTLTDENNNTRSETFPLANTAQAFAGLARACAL